MPNQIYSSIPCVSKKLLGTKLISRQTRNLQTAYFTSCRRCALKNTIITKTAWPEGTTVRLLTKEITYILFFSPQFWTKLLTKNVLSTWKVSRRDEKAERVKFQKSSTRYFGHYTMQASLLFYAWDIAKKPREEWGGERQNKRVWNKSG